MKKIYFLLLLNVSIGFSQAGAPANPYYNGFNWAQTGLTLKTSLATKITTTHTNNLSYANAENAILVTDLDPTDLTNTNLLLLYGFSVTQCPASTTDDKDHRRRDKSMQDVGNANPCQWNREHTYPKALGVPDLGTSGPGADAHNLRACDKKRNADRNNDTFFSGSGNSFETGLNWYPGDEWKGDVARMMMYMYLRYGDQCLPINVGTGTSPSSDSNMLNLFLQWNAEDPVSLYEDNRNTYLGNTSNTYAQGNRNPFIDNPYLATVIWGGVVAENRWPAIFLSVDSFELIADINIYPNPSIDQKINIETENQLDNIQLININGQIMQEIKKPTAQNHTYTLENLPKGFYFLKLSADTRSITKKVIIN